LLFRNTEYPKFVGSCNSSFFSLAQSKKYHRGDFEIWDFHHLEKLARLKLTTTISSLSLGQSVCLKKHSDTIQISDKFIIENKGEKKLAQTRALAQNHNRPLSCLPPILITFFFASVTAGHWKRGSRYRIQRLQSDTNVL